MLASVYLVAVALATRGLGDVRRQPRCSCAAGAVPGAARFVLLTLGISWILRLSPALNR